MRTNAFRILGFFVIAVSWYVDTNNFLLFCPVDGTNNIEYLELFQTRLDKVLCSLL